MTNDSHHEHAELREWAGAYALGSLDPDDRRTFERHLSDCSRCAEEVNAFAAIPGLLARVDVADLREPSIETADAITHRAAEEAGSLRASRNRWRTSAMTVVAATLMVLTVGAVVRFAAQDDATSRPVVAATVTASQAASSEISTSARTWGTEIVVRADGLPERTEYQLWGVDDTGAWSIAATWGPTPTGRANITGATSLPTASLDRIVVTSEDRTDILIDSTV